MFGKAKKAKASYGIVGLGRFGLALAIELAEAGEDLVVLDQEEEKVRIMRDYTEAAYVVNSLDKKTLEETGIQNCDVAVVCIGEKMDVSILTTLHLVSMGIPTVIAKAASEEQGQVASPPSSPRPPARSRARSCASWAPRWSTPSTTWPSVWPTGWRPPGCWTLSS